MKTLKTKIPKGFQIDKEKSTFEEIVFNPIEDEWVDWEGLGYINGWYIGNASDVYQADNDCSAEHHQRSIFPTKQDAESVLALAQLLQLRKRVIGDWEADWQKNNGKIKYVIFREQFDLQTDWTYNNFHELSFPTAEKRNKFLEKYRDLIEIYFKIK